MWNQLSPQQQQYLMAMLLGGHGAVGQPAGGMPAGMPGGAQPMLGQAQQPVSGANMPLSMPMNPGLSNPLMTGGNSAVNPQQQAQMMQYMQMLNSPQGGSAAANGNPALWQMLMGRSPMYGTGGAVS